MEVREAREHVRTTRSKARASRTSAGSSGKQKHGHLCYVDSEVCISIYSLYTHTHTHTYTPYRRFLIVSAHVQWLYTTLFIVLAPYL